MQLTGGKLFSTRFAHESFCPLVVLGQVLDVLVLVDGGEVTKLAVDDHPLHVRVSQPNVLVQVFGVQSLKVTMLASANDILIPPITGRDIEFLFTSIRIAFTQSSYAILKVYF